MLLHAAQVEIEPGVGLNVVPAKQKRQAADGVSRVDSLPLTYCLSLSHLSLSQFSSCLFVVLEGFFIFKLNVVMLSSLSFLYRFSSLYGRGSRSCRGRTLASHVYPSRTILRDSYSIAPVASTRNVKSI